MPQLPEHRVLEEGGEGRPELLGDDEQFMASLQEQLENPDPREIGRILRKLSEYARSPDRDVRVMTDPTLDTFCVAEVPAKRTMPDGSLQDDPSRKSYIIGAPFTFIAGQAPMDFLQGEIIHELGHAGGRHSSYTDFSRMSRFRELAQRAGVAPDLLTSFDNCVEDPRIERLMGGRKYPEERRLLLEKNRQLIIPNISRGIRSGNLSLPDQLKFIVKLEGLWEHSRWFFGDESRPYSMDDLHPEVRVSFDRIEEHVRRIFGTQDRQAMKINPKIEALIVEYVWPELLRLQELQDTMPSPPSGPGEGPKGPPGSPTPGSESLDDEDGHYDPEDIDSWPEELKKIMKQFIEQHEKDQEEEAERKKREKEEADKENQSLEEGKHELLKARDGIETLEDRQQYAELSSGLASTIFAIKRTFDQHIPKTLETETRLGRRGTRFDTSAYVQQQSSGRIAPMRRREVPEEKAMVLQVVIDVSGSMWNPKERIVNALKASIAVLEAGKDRNIAIEILASDDRNISDDEALYTIKSFDQPFDGRVKTKIARIEKLFGGGNRDAASILAAYPRVAKQERKMRALADRIGKLMVFISDSTTPDDATREAANEARKRTPLEGTAITPEADIADKVKAHFGPESLIPPSVQQFPATLGKILSRHMMKLRSRQ